jgi:hypothetical protein
MKKKIWLLTMVGVMLCGQAAWAQSDFYVIAGGGRVGTQITALPYTISTPGFYFLGGNLTFNGSGNAITVVTNDVTIDLMGFTLKNTAAVPGNGIHMNGIENVEVRNGTVSGFAYGIVEFDGVLGNKHRAINVRATNNLIGIAFGCSNALIKNCNCSKNSSS